MENCKDVEKDLTVKTLHKAVDWIANDCCEDICQICANFNASEQAAALDENEDLECCKHRRANGTIACRNGIIEHFRAEVKHDQTEANPL